MFKELRPAIVLLACFTLLTGVAYPLLTTASARLAFPRQAAGSLIARDGVVVGSELIGQPFDDPRYFWGRPSSTGPAAYNASASGASNLGPSNAALAQAVSARARSLREADPDNHAPIPIDLVTSSGSGLDPHISPAAALWQVSRVARARGLPEDQVRSLVLSRVQPRTLGILGEVRVNVLELNLALDSILSSGGSMVKLDHE
ncbi:MAG: potassium-transporting ATPase subunit KdpC [Deltaproteobacteria bacterium]|nr:potassium-transporting ATPase subunit KdpC [Deltaproteobacteria bacterium]